MTKTFKNLKEACMYINDHNWLDTKQDKQFRKDIYKNIKRG